MCELDVCGLCVVGGSNDVMFRRREGGGATGGRRDVEAANCPPHDAGEGDAATGRVRPIRILVMIRG